jgi:hypothetical protein
MKRKKTCMEVNGPRERRDEKMCAAKAVVCIQQMRKREEENWAGHCLQVVNKGGGAVCVGGGGGV